jgi:hypothetical protein
MLRCPQTVGAAPTCTCLTAGTQSWFVACLFRLAPHHLPLRARVKLFIKPQRYFNILRPIAVTIPFFDT